MMSKSFTKDSDDYNEPDKPEINIDHTKNYVTPAGLMALQQEFKKLLYEERPKVVEIVRWAAGNGDRSENADYTYGKKRLREIDKRVRYLNKRIESAVVVDPQIQQNLTKVFFGATVTFKQTNGEEKTLAIVGIDEADLNLKKISWTSPVAKALIKSSIGDTVTFQSPRGEEKLYIINISYKV